ncbi:MAG: cation transporter [Clostridiales bacterium]|jgi:cation diffusion facilitator family transporter|nr:cation transporter [Clostridiales bacterium]
MNKYKQVTQVLWIILLANLGVAVIKIIIGSMIRSTSMAADGFHSLTDGTSNIVGLVGIYLASKPIDKEHPYGYRKFEMMAGLFIAGMLFIICGNILVKAIRKIRFPVQPEITFLSILSLLLTLIVNIFVCMYEYKAGKKLESQILISDSMHTRSDIFVSLGVLITLIGIRLGLPIIIDPLVSFVVAGFIIHAAAEIFKVNSSVLLDRAVVDTEQIKNIAMEFEQVKGIHNIRSRGYKDDLYIDMHIMTEPELSVEKSHELTHCIEKKIRENINMNAQLIAHIEPYEAVHKEPHDKY